MLNQQEPPIVQQAYSGRVLSGHVTPKEKRQLQSAVKRGILSELPCVDYPTCRFHKTVWVMHIDKQIALLKEQQ